jgi:putative nucleotidyltransferase with HDIG domain
VFYLGLETISTLVLCLQIFALHERTPTQEFSYATLWSHSIATGMLAQHIASVENAGETSSLVEQSFTAGLLHDIGKLLLVNSLPRRYSEALKLQQQQHWSSWRAEKEIFATTHSEVGAYLLGLWGLPEDIVEAVAFHHEPGLTLARHFSPLTAVHAADALGHISASKVEPTESELDLQYLTQMGLQEHVDQWREKAVKEEDHLAGSLLTD